MSDVQTIPPQVLTPVCAVRWWAAHAVLFFFVVWPYSSRHFHAMKLTFRSKMIGRGIDIGLKRRHICLEKTDRPQNGLRRRRAPTAAADC